MLMLFTMSYLAIGAAITSVLYGTTLKDNESFSTLQKVGTVGVSILLSPILALITWLMAMFGGRK